LVFVYNLRAELRVKLGRRAEKKGQKIWRLNKRALVRRGGAIVNLCLVVQLKLWEEASERFHCLATFELDAL
jgi:hypothetical protein